MKIRCVVLGLAVSLNITLLSLALPVNHRTASPSIEKPRMVADGIPLPPPPPPKKNGYVARQQNKKTG